MADKQYGLSPNEVRILREEQAKRIDMRNEFIRKAYNPFRHATSEGGHMVDSAVLRYQAMHVSHLEWFRPTPRTSFWGILFTVGIMGGFSMLVKSEREGRLHKYSTGQVSYRDRPFKLV